MTTTTILERVEGRYEILEEPYGKVYKWVPGHALIECDCGQVFSIEGTMAASCPRCDADYTGVDMRLADKTLKEDETYTQAQREYEEWMKGEEEHLSHPEALYSGGLFSGLAAKDEMNRILDVLYGS